MAYAIFPPGGEGGLRGYIVLHLHLSEDVRKELHIMWRLRAGGNCWMAVELLHVKMIFFFNIKHENLTACTHPAEKFPNCPNQNSD
jgi:hypothetical protein